MINNFELSKFSKLARYEIIKQTFLKKSGHLGGALSCADILVNIFNRYVLDKKNNKFILSKGHCALAMYAVLYISKKIKKKQFESFSEKGSYFGEHSSPKIKNDYIHFSTGSLGHGLSFAAGISYSNKLIKKSGYTIVLMSDGEMNSGTVWEAALISSKLKLDNLIVIVDYNKFQATGKSDEILNIKPLAAKWKSFGWKVVECDGNNHSSINYSLKKISKSFHKPKIVIAHTIKGKGVSFMEADNNWHYRSPSKEELEKAKIELKIK